MAPLKKEAAPKAAKAEKAPKKEAAEKAAAPKAEKAAKPAKKAAAPKAASKGGVVASHLYDVLERPLVTEKSARMGEHNKVVFKINATATKTDVKRAVEALFGVTVTKVNTINLPGKVKRFRGNPGTRQDTRKAIVTLAEGQSIDFAGGLR